MPRSNDNGRALEYAIVDLLQRRGARLTAQAMQSQFRDVRAYNELPEAQRLEYNAAADQLLVWLEDDNRFSAGAAVDRLADGAGVAGDVTDIRIEFQRETNLSIKHNHEDTKHPRPSRTAVQMGFAKGSGVDRVFRDRLTGVYEEFLSVAQPAPDGPTTFIDLPPGLVGSLLYRPTCDLVTEFYLEHGFQSQHASLLFDFLIGNRGFHKVVVRDGSVQVQDFTCVPAPTAMLAERPNDSHITLLFSNDWMLDLRLHTSTKTIKPSAAATLKFAASIVSNNGDITVISL